MSLKQSLSNLNDEERAVIKECLQATVDSIIFPEWEFGTIFGLSRDEVRDVLASWPNVDENDEKVTRAINNSLNNLLFYPDRNKGEQWRKFISASPSKVALILDKWKGRFPRTSVKGRDYVDDVM